MGTSTRKNNNVNVPASIQKDSIESEEKRNLEARVNNLSNCVVHDDTFDWGGQSNPLLRGKLKLE